MSYEGCYLCKFILVVNAKVICKVCILNLNVSPPYLFHWTADHTLSLISMLDRSKRQQTMFFVLL